MITVIALRELRSMFLSPLAWTILTVSQLILYLVFSLLIEDFFKIQPELNTIPNAPGVTDLIISPLLGWAGIVMLILSPLLTMRLISDERRNGTLTLLLSSPISMTEIVLGKFLGIILFYFIFISMISLMPLSLLLGAELDLGKLAAGLLGLTLSLLAYASVGLFLSSLTTNPIVAAVNTFGLLFFLWILSLIPDNSFSYISITTHFNTISRGIIDSADLAYFALFIITFLLLTIRQLDAQRLQK